ncbi:MAG: acyl-CoA thioesterase [Bdellovibrionales bacterium]|nr:acyl-CoA thioesterase [Bdellovibrionales bacterium]
MAQNEIGSYELVIRERHLDTFGHVNNATYFEMLEEARWELISARGYDLAYIQKCKQGPVILEASIQFRKELVLRKKVNITTELLEYKNKIGTLEQKICFENGEVAAKAKLVFGLFDLRQRQLIEPTDEWKRAIGFVED